MKSKIILLVVILLAAVSFSFAQAKNKNGGGAMKSNPIDSALTNMEKTAWNYLVDKKYDTFAKMFAEDYQGMYEEDMTTKASEIALVKQVTFKNADVSNIKITHPAANMAIVTASVKVEMTMPNGQTMSDPMRSSTVYVKRGSQWLIVYHSHVPVRAM